MRKILTSLAILLAFTMLSGCAGGSGGGGSDDGQVLTVRDRKTGKVLSIGDGPDQINDITGGDERNTIYFEDQDVYSSDYYDVEGILVGTLNDQVVTINIYDINRWEHTSGVRIGMGEAKAWKIYEGNDMVERGTSGGILISYDENLNQIPFDQDSPYRVIITFEDGKVDFISVQKYVETIA